MPLFIKEDRQELNKTLITDGRIDRSYYKSVAKAGRSRFFESDWPTEKEEQVEQIQQKMQMKIWTQKKNIWLLKIYV